MDGHENQCSSWEFFIWLWNLVLFQAVEGSDKTLGREQKREDAGHSSTEHWLAWETLFIPPKVMPRKEALQCRVSPLSYTWTQSLNTEFALFFSLFPRH